MKRFKGTKGKWIPHIIKFDRDPKEIIIGVKIEVAPNYYETIFNTVFPNTDNEYIKEHEKIKANVSLICSAPELLEILIRIIEARKIGNELALSEMENIVNKALGE